MSKIGRFFILAFALLVAGCDGETKPPSSSKVPYSVQGLDPFTTLLEVDYEGRRHVFILRPDSIAKLGDYPIAVTNNVP